MKNLLALSLFLLLTGTLQAQDVYAKKGVAVDGYDLISYHEGKPLQGSETYSYSHEGISYHFTTAAHRDTFAKSPAKYLPRYGGWCAYAMGVNGDRVKINPERYKIINGKLYLFYDFGKTNTLTLWNQEEQKLLPAADAYWANRKN